MLECKSNCTLLEGVQCVLWWPIYAKRREPVGPTFWSLPSRGFVYKFKKLNKVQNLRGMATASKSRHVLLTGPPGVGKTTLVQKACDTLRQRGVEVQGFYTQERRERGSRTGFDVVTLDGQRAPLATISDDSMPSTRREYRVGKYTVQLHTFESIALPTLKVGEKHAVVIIDEIGKMELFSESFKQAVRGVISQPHTTVLATIPIAKGRPIPFVEDIRTRKDAQLFTVSRENRNGLLDEIVSTILSSHLTSTS